MQQTRLQIYIVWFQLSTEKSQNNIVGLPGGFAVRRNEFAEGKHMLRSCMSIRYRLVGRNFMVFSMFFIGFTLTFARCLRDQG